jgi:hypothetical protein
MHLRSFFTGAAVGAAAAYLLDPVAGTGRRSRLRDQTGALIRRGEERADDLGRHATNVVQGKVREMTTAPERSMDDGTVEARIRSEVLGRGDVDASGIVVNVEDGVAVLRGEVSGPDDAIAGIVDRTKAVEGVREVRNLLHVPGAPAPNKEAARAAKPTAGTSGTSGTSSTPGSSGRSSSPSTGSTSSTTSGSSSGSTTSRSSSSTKPTGSSSSSS